MPAPTLNDLLDDGRIQRLFSADVRPCALQLWILQLKSKTTQEYRLLYGRLLPYSFANNTWSATDDDNFEAFDAFQAQIVRLNLYISSEKCKALLRELCTGRTLCDLSLNQGLTLSEKLRKRFGGAALAVDSLAFRPVAYLFNRDAHEVQALSSPHGAAGALSAAISRLDKEALLQLDGNYDVALTAWMIRRLNSETGLRFAGVDAQRLGELELLVFPTLDDHDRSLMHMDWSGSGSSLALRFNPTQLPYFGGFQVRLSVENGNNTVLSQICPAEPGEQDWLQCQFEMSNHVRESMDSTEFEVSRVDVPLGLTRALDRREGRRQIRQAASSAFRKRRIRT